MVKPGTRAAQVTTSGLVSRQNHDLLLKLVCALHWRALHSDAVGLGCPLFIRAYEIAQDDQ